MSKTQRESSTASQFRRERPRVHGSLVAGRASTAEASEERPARGGRDKAVRIGHTRVGKGIFAQKRYPAAAVIGEILGEVIDDANYGSDYCMHIGGTCQLEPAPPFRFVNHNCEPNCEFDFFDLTEPGETQSRRRVFLISLREIKPGEELTIDYNWSAGAAIPCRCQAATCRGWIVDPAQLPELRARLERPAPPL